MPKRKDINSILVIGSGPIVIGQACEFDYSGSQACKALKEEGFKVILVNSNPATIMTDPEIADVTYIEPLTVEFIEKIIDKERPDALLPTLGGQTALNLTVKLYEEGILDKYKVKLIGANVEAIKKGEDRELFKKSMEKIGLKCPYSKAVHSLEEAIEVATNIGFPVIIRPAFTLGGTGGGIAYNIDEFKVIAERGLRASMIGEILVEESLIGWKEFEFEVMRDKKDNVVIVCSIENFDPMGVHTGDSITVAPAQTLTDKQYQVLRDAAIAIIREIGVETGGSNIQFAVNPEKFDFMVIEMNPRVSRSSALASKATGFPIAKIAAKLAIGYTLDEIPNDITKETPASFEPTLDYVVVKMPRFTFEKFPDARPVLGTQMKSVGETMAIGRSFKEAFVKAIVGLETGKKFFEGILTKDSTLLENPDKIRQTITSKLIEPNPERIFYIRDALEIGMTIDEIYEYTKIDKWFLYNMREILDAEKTIPSKLEDITYDQMKYYKQIGITDYLIALKTNKTEIEVREYRKTLGVTPTYRIVDTCAAEFEAKTPYYYSTYDEECEYIPNENKKVVILGSGPNRIGQGIEFDYCCVHCSIEAKKIGYDAIMINSNPETVSTDHDISSRLYFEPLTFEHVMNIIEKENPDGVILQFGGQTPLKLSLQLRKAGVKILGTSAESIDIAEDREKFRELLNNLNIKQPESRTSTSIESALKMAEELGYPVLVRPSYVLGGRAMNIVYSEEEFLEYAREAIKVSEGSPILIDKFLQDAIEIDVDAVSDGNDVVIAGIMEHIEEAGVHSGDSATVLPPFSLSEKIINKIKEYTISIAKSLNVIGLINIQYAVKDGEVYVLEANPRASRTIPFVSKATGIPWAKIATRVILGQSLKEIGVKEPKLNYYAVKEVVLPFDKFPEVEPILGPEMKSTGEVMGIDETFPMAYAKAEIAAGTNLSLKSVLLTIDDKDKHKILNIAKSLQEIGVKIYATSGTHNFLNQNGVQSELVLKIGEGRPDLLDQIKNGKIGMVFNTTRTRKSIKDEVSIRKLAIRYKIPLITTVPAMYAAVEALKSIKEKEFKVKSLQEYKNGKY
ncbi:MAG: carbamoyl-phosphate synthase large subunit [Brevinematales bacterium]|nr:carbamoyl-phosphate synthase large subunit [Brevinematales bacterium]